MSFTSIPFIALMLVVMAVWPAVRAKNMSRWVFLCTVSFVFYAWWDWRFLFLLLGSGSIDYLAALGMAAWPHRRRLLLIVSLAVNIGGLVFFKYLSFAVWQLRLMLEMPESQWGWTNSIVLPVGISFYTFQSMSYSIDCYRGRIQPTRNPFHFMAYLSMFPQLVAGPIVRASDLLPQLCTPGHFNRANRFAGLSLMTRGFVKKMVIADNLAPAVNAIFAQESVSGHASLWWLAGILFAIQILADFSGYTDIARGIAQWLGYRFPENFRYPYVARSFKEFWSRWHISLSTWFRDYVYIPLGGSRVRASRASVNVMFTMLVSGLWHGANWTFLIWGGLHGGMLLVERILPAWLKPPGIVGAIIRWIVVMAVVVVGWNVFRANSAGQAWEIVVSMFSGNWSLASVHGALDAHARLALMACVVVTIVMVFSDRFARVLPIWVRSAAVVLGVFAAVYLRGPGDDFIYFQF